ncbi:MAG: hypothetical protein NTV37_08780 [Proteobacteria bacterium]|nr:hypothetical protein [Pseudomonadota bacterium]
MPDSKPDGVVQTNAPNTGRLLRVSSTPDATNPDLAKLLRDLSDDFSGAPIS